MESKPSKMSIYDQIAAKYKKPMERMFYICFAIIFTYDYVSSSMMMFPFTAFIGNSLMKILPYDLVMPVYEMVLNLRHLIVIPALFTICFEAKGTGRKIMLATLLVIAWIYAVHWREQGDTMIFSSLLVIVACYGKDIKKIIRIALISGASVIFVAFVLSRFGLIEDLSWNRPDSTFDRHAFGMNYCTDLACHVLYLILLYMFYRRGKLRWWEYAVMLVLCLVNVLFVDGRIALICTTLAIVGCGVNALLQKKQWRIPKKIMDLWKWALILSFVIGAAILFGWDVIYDPDPNVWYNHSVSLGNRLWTNYLLFTQVPVTLLGTWFLQVGYGGTSGELAYYFWVDCSYTRLFAMYGVIAFGIYMSLLTGVQVRLAKRKNHFAMFLMALVALDCLMEHHLIEVAFNTFLVFAFANIDGTDSKEESMKTSEDPDEKSLEQEETE